MVRRTFMQRFARWHIWLGWLVAVPVLLWLGSGLVMVLRPIEEVRGETLRIERKTVLPPDTDIRITLPPAGPAVERVEVAVEDGRVVTRLIGHEGSVDRFDEQGRRLPDLDAAAARALVAREIRGGGRVVSTRLFPRDAPPGDFRRPITVWQVTLADGTRVYVGRETARIEAVRTRWWRVFDAAWGLHIMDWRGREDTSHPLLIGFSALALFASLLGTVLLFRRRRSRLKP